MNGSSKRLFDQLVGWHTEFKFNNKIASVTSLDDNIVAARERIKKDCEEAHHCGGLLEIVLLSEAYWRYKMEPYFSAVRSAFSFRRVRPKVVEYLSKSVDDREELLMGLLSKGNRDSVLCAIGHFCTTYPSRLSHFKTELSRSEFLLIA